MKQTYSYHSHTNTYNIFDGKNSIEEMIQKAEEIGYRELGISNHLICYQDNSDFLHSMVFSNPQEAEDVYKNLINEIREAGAKSKIKILVGFEVDFFNNVDWRRMFEKMIKNLEVDYLIGSTHNIFASDFKSAYNIYPFRDGSATLDRDYAKEITYTYWQNVEESIKSGYFDFIAHFDLLKITGLEMNTKSQEALSSLVETFGKYRHPYELNTSTMNKFPEQSPSLSLLKELNKRNVPLIISDDAHSTAQLGQHFDVADKLLDDIGYTNRFKL